jgi:hypothetical protein
LRIHSILQSISLIPNSIFLPELDRIFPLSTGGQILFQLNHDTVQILGAHLFTLARLLTQRYISHSLIDNVPGLVSWVYRNFLQIKLLVDLFLHEETNAVNLSIPIEETRLSDNVDSNETIHEHSSAAPYNRTAQENDEHLDGPQKPEVSHTLGLSTAFCYALSETMTNILFLPFDTFFFRALAHHYVARGVPLPPQTPSILPTSLIPWYGQTSFTPWAVDTALCILTNFIIKAALY